jgi:hypothetical protein
MGNMNLTAGSQVYVVNDEILVTASAMDADNSSDTRIYNQTSPARDTQNDEVDDTTTTDDVDNQTEQQESEEPVRGMW